MDTDLARLAAVHGVATEYRNWNDRPQLVPIDTVRAALAALEVDASGPAAIETALRQADEAPWQRAAPPCVVATVGDGGGGPISLAVPSGATLEVTVTTAAGVSHALTVDDCTDVPVRVVDGVRRERRRVLLPATLEPGEHRLRVRAGEEETTSILLAVPARCPVPPRPLWGWQVQLYALRGAASWGIGDLGDLAGLLSRAGREHGAALVLLNPLHAVAPVLPQENSPYSPASRRFVNPLYLRVEHCDGYALLAPEERTRVDALAAQARRLNAVDRIDRDDVFRAKRAAFAILAAQGLPPARAADYARYRALEGPGLLDFATASALAERYGGAFRDWPAALQDPRSPAVAKAADELAEAVALQYWLQWQCDVQLAAAAAAARQAGMAVGMVADLAVGVDPDGADAWALQAELATDMSIGAPPDSFNQRGQDWGLPPLRPDRLHANGFAPFRDLLRTTLRHAGGIRVDHAMGLFRLFWIPRGASAAEGTYVRYPAAGLLGALALEANAAGAVVIGEDLGTVERGIPETLRDHGVLGSRVLWFEREQHAQGAAAQQRAPRLGSGGYPPLALASVTTHDLPTAAGFLADEATLVRARLGQLSHDEVTERANAAMDRSELFALLMGEGLLRAAPDDPAAPAADLEPSEVALAMHAFVARTPSLLATAALADVVGDLRQPNLPGTTDQYPNWRLPLSEPTGVRQSDELLPPSRPLSMEQVLDDPRVAIYAKIMGAARQSPKEASRPGA